MHTILVPFDGSGHALKALHIACDLADKYRGRVALLHVIAVDRKPADLLSLLVAKEFGPTITGRLKDAADKAENTSPLPENLLRDVGDKILDQAAARARRRDVETQLLPLAEGDPTEAILVAKRQADANTIVMGCRGLSDEKAGTFGSVSHNVFERADCTCISVK